MNSMKRQKYMTLKDECPRLVGAQMLLVKSKDIALEGMKILSQSGNNIQLCMYLLEKVKSNAIKNDIA